LNLTQSAVAAGVLGVGVYLLFIGLLLARGRRSDAWALASFIPDCIVFVHRLLQDGRVPRRRRLLLVGLVGYLAMPFDLVPDFIPVAGQLDDAILVAMALRIVLRGAGPTLVRELWPGPVGSLRLMLRLAGRGGP